MVRNLRQLWRHRDPLVRLASLQVASLLASQRRGAEVLVPSTGLSIEEATENLIWLDF